MVSINHNGEASIVIADWQASIGVIHVIDRILDESAKPGSDTLLSAFSTAESLSTFAQLLESSGVLSGIVGSDTSFAPKSKDLEQFSTEDDTEKLRYVLKYHMLLLPSDLRNFEKLETLEGSSVSVERSWFLWYIGGLSSINVLHFAPNERVEASGWRLYVIDNMLVSSENYRYSSYHVCIENKLVSHMQPNYPNEC